MHTGITPEIRVYLPTRKSALNKGLNCISLIATQNEFDARQVDGADDDRQQQGAQERTGDGPDAAFEAGGVNNNMLLPLSRFRMIPLCAVSFA